MNVLVAPDELRRRLTIPEKLALAAEIVTTYGGVRWALWRHRDLEQLLATLRGRAPEGKTEVSRLEQYAGFRLGRLIGRTLRWVPADSRCLVRSLVLVALLARRGIPSTLVIGVKSGPEFEAHAWVEMSGLQVLPAEESVFTRIAEL